MVSLTLVWTAGNLAQAVGSTADIFVPPSNLPQFQLQPPAHLGRLVDYFNAQQPSDGVIKRANNSEPAPLVILIQDLHAHYGVQKNIAGLLEFLNQKLTSLPSLSSNAPRSSLPFALATEGAWGVVDNSVLTSCPDAKVRFATTDYLLREAEITGADLFAVRRGLPQAVVGVENQNFYNVDRELFRQSLDGRQNLVKMLNDIGGDLETLPRSLFSSNMKSVEVDQLAYRNGRLSSEDWILRVAARPEAKALDVKKNFPVLARFIAGSQSLPQGTRHVITSQFLTQIEGQLSAQEKTNLRVLTKNESALPYYRYLRELIIEKQLFMAVPLSLAQFLEYLHTSETSEMDHVLFETQELSYQIQLAMAQGQARDLVRVRHDVDLLRRVADLQATEFEVRAFAPRLPEFLALTRTLLTGSSALYDAPTLRRLVSAAIDYYVMAMARNQPMLDHALALGGPSNVVLVAGGFHTAPLTQLLRDKNISYVVLTPEVKLISNQDRLLYIKRLKGDYLTESEVLGAATSSTGNLTLALTTQGNSSSDQLAVARGAGFNILARFVERVTNSKIYRKPLPAIEILETRTPRSDLEPRIREIVEGDDTLIGRYVAAASEALNDVLDLAAASGLTGGATKSAQNSWTSGYLSERFKSGLDADKLKQILDLLTDNGLESSNNSPEQAERSAHYALGRISDLQLTFPPPLKVMGMALGQSRPHIGSEKDSSMRLSRLKSIVGSVNASGEKSNGDLEEQPDLGRAGQFRGLTRKEPSSVPASLPTRGKTFVVGGHIAKGFNAEERATIMAGAKDISNPEHFKVEALLTLAKSLGIPAQSLVGDTQHLARVIDEIISKRQDLQVPLKLAAGETDQTIGEYLIRAVHHLVETPLRSIPYVGDVLAIEETERYLLGEGESTHIALLEGFYDVRSSIYKHLSQALWHEALEAVTPNQDDVHCALIQQIQARFFDRETFRSDVRHYINEMVLAQNAEADIRQSLLDVTNTGAVQQMQRYEQLNGHDLSTPEKDYLTRALRAARALQATQRTAVKNGIVFTIQSVQLNEYERRDFALIEPVLGKSPVNDLAYSLSQDTDIRVVYFPFLLEQSGGDAIYDPELKMVGISRTSFLNGTAGLNESHEVDHALVDGFPWSGFKGRFEVAGAKQLSSKGGTDLDAYAERMSVDELWTFAREMVSLAGLATSGAPQNGYLSLLSSTVKLAVELADQAQNVTQRALTALQNGSAKLSTNYFETTYRVLGQIHHVDVAEITLEFSGIRIILPLSDIPRSASMSDVIMPAVLKRLSEIESMSEDLSQRFKHIDSVVDRIRLDGSSSDEAAKRRSVNFSELLGASERLGATVLRYHKNEGAPRGHAVPNAPRLGTARLGGHWLQDMPSSETKQSVKLSNDERTRLSQLWNDDVLPLPMFHGTSTNNIHTLESKGLDANSKAFDVKQIQRFSDLYAKAYVEPYPMDQNHKTGIINVTYDLTQASSYAIHGPEVVRLTIQQIENLLKANGPRSKLDLREIEELESIKNNLQFWMSTHSPLMLQFHFRDIPEAERPKYLQNFDALAQCYVQLRDQAGESLDSFIQQQWPSLRSGLTNVKITHISPENIEVVNLDGHNPRALIGSSLTLAPTRKAGQIRYRLGLWALFQWRWFGTETERRAIEAELAAVSERMTEDDHFRETKLIEKNFAPLWEIIRSLQRGFLAAHGDLYQDDDERNAQVRQIRAEGIRQLRYWTYGTFAVFLGLGLALASGHPSVFVQHPAVTSILWLVMTVIFAGAANVRKHRAHNIRYGTGNSVGIEATLTTSSREIMDPDKRKELESKPLSLRNELFAWEIWSEEIRVRRQMVLPFQMADEKYWMNILEQKISFHDDIVREKYQQLAKSMIAELRGRLFTQITKQEIPEKLLKFQSVVTSRIRDLETKIYSQGVSQRKPSVAFTVHANELNGDPLFPIHSPILIVTQATEPVLNDELLQSIRQRIVIADAESASEWQAANNYLDGIFKEMIGKPLSIYMQDLFQFFARGPGQSIAIEFRPGITTDPNRGGMGVWSEDSAEGRHIVYFGYPFENRHTKDERTAVDVLKHEMSHVFDALREQNFPSSSELQGYEGKARHRLAFRELRANLWAFDGDLQKAVSVTRVAYPRVLENIFEMIGDIDQQKPENIYRFFWLLSKATDKQLYDSNESDLATVRQIWKDVIHTSVLPTKTLEASSIGSNSLQTVALVAFNTKTSHGFPAINVENYEILRQMSLDDRVEIETREGLRDKIQQVTGRELIQLLDRKSLYSLRVVSLLDRGESAIPDNLLEKLDPALRSEFASGRPIRVWIKLSSGEVAYAVGDPIMIVAMAGQENVDSIILGRPLPMMRSFLDIDRNERVANFPWTERMKKMLPSSVYSNSANTDLLGLEVYHGTHRASVQKVEQGPANIGKGFGGRGLYVAIKGDRSIAEHFAERAQSNGSVAEETVKPTTDSIVMTGVIAAKPMRVGTFEITRDGLTDLSNGVLKANWADDPNLRTLLESEFDILDLRNMRSTGLVIDTDRFLVFHESAGRDAIHWQQPVHGGMMFRNWKWLKRSGLESLRLAPLLFLASHWHMSAPNVLLLTLGSLILMHVGQYFFKVNGRRTSVMESAPFWVVAVAELLAVSAALVWPAALGIAVVVAIAAHYTVNIWVKRHYGDPKAGHTLLMAVEHMTVDTKFDHSDSQPLSDAVSDLSAPAINEVQSAFDKVSVRDLLTAA